MNCRNCGSPLGPNEVFCRMCGVSVDMQPQQQAPVQSQAPVQPQTPIQPQVQIQPQVPVQPQIQEVSQISTPLPTAPQPSVTTTNFPQQDISQNVQPSSGGVPPITPVVPPSLGVPNTTTVQTPITQNLMVSNDTTQQSVGTQKNSNSKILIAIIVVVIIAIVGIVLYFTVFKNSGGSSGGDSSSNSSSPSSSNDSSSNSGSNSGSNPVTSESTFTTNHGGFTFQIPVQYETSVEGDYLVVTDGSSWKLGIVPVLGTYEYISLEELKNMITKDGASEAEVDKSNINGREYIVMKYSSSESKEIVVYTKANSYYVFGVKVITTANKYGTDLLNIVDGILDTAVYSGTGNSFGMTNSPFNVKKYITK